MTGSPAVMFETYEAVLDPVMNAGATLNRVLPSAA